MPNEITGAAARSAKASKTLDTMRARIVKADAARTGAAHQARAAQVKMIEEASPHTRGWTLAGHSLTTALQGFPAHAGMDPVFACSDRISGGLPRTRGDGPAPGRGQVGARR